MVKLGRMADTFHGSGKLMEKNSTSWNRLITDYIKCGKIQDALFLYRNLDKDEPISISGHSFVALLRACTKLQDYSQVVEIHADILKRGLLKSDLVVCNTLVDSYTKCGSLLKAKQIFDELSVCDVISWTALISGYVDHGHSEDALQCFCRMQSECVLPNFVTFICSLKACGTLGAIGKGLELHVVIEGNGALERETTVGNALVDMYSKCGLLAEAAQVFDNLASKDVVTWTTLIAGCAEHGDGVRAFKYFKAMKAAGVPPNNHTLACSLKAFGNKSAIDEVEEIHTQIRNTGIFMEDVVLGNTLIDAYNHCGFVSKAKDVFDELPVQNVITWTSLISGYADHCCDEAAMECFGRMQLEGVCPDALTLVCGMKACGNIGAIHRGYQIHIAAKWKGLLGRDILVGNALVNMYAKCGVLNEAQDVFDNLPIHEAILWTTLIATYRGHGCNAEAIMCFENMQAEGVLPNSLTLIYCLKACSSMHMVSKGQEIHSVAEKRGLLQKEPAFGNNLVEAYTECGMFVEALELFDILPSRNATSWNALILGYADQGNNGLALTYFEHMQLEGLLPTPLTYSGSLRACGNMQAIDKGQELHMEIEKKGLFEADDAVGNTLVDMYSKFGMSYEAEQAFERVQFKGIVSWNALINGYIEYGLDEAAIKCFDLMQLDGVAPDVFTYVCSLKACANIRAVEKGRTIHADIDGMKQLSTDPTINNALLNMYIKFGFLGKAEEAFDNIFDHDVISWTMLTKGYVEYGQPEQSLRCFEQMQNEGITPNAITLITILKACSSMGTLVRSKELHCRMMYTTGLEGDPTTIGNALLHAYIKCSSLAVAQDMFDELQKRDISSWTSLIAGYVEHGHGDKAVECFNLMLLEGISPDEFTYICVLKAYAITGALEKGQQIHCEIERIGLLDRDIIASNSVIDMYVKCGFVTIAQEVFDKLHGHDIISWNTLITGYANCGYGEKVLECYAQMQLEGVFPNAVTYFSILKACGSIKASEKCQEIHALIERLIEREGFVGTDYSVYNTLIDIYFECGMLPKVEEVFVKLPVRNVVSWTTLIAGYARCDREEQALNSFERMRLENVCPNLVTFICSLKACGNIGSVSKGQEIHSEIEKKGLVQRAAVSNTLIDLYSKCGLVAEACKVIQSTSCGDIVPWNALLQGYSQLGASENILCIFHSIMEQGIQPSETTFLILLSACSRVGWSFYIGEMFFETMNKQYGIPPSNKHVTGMVDLLCRLGDIDNAMAMVERMPLCTTSIVAWHCVLCFCRESGNVHLGKKALDRITMLNENDASSIIV